MTLLETLYGVSMQEDEFEEIALIAFNLIGNKRYKLYKFTTCVNDCSQAIQLPCNCDQVEAVTYNWEDWNYVSNIYQNGDINSAFTETYIESRKILQDFLYANGKFVKFRQVGDLLYVDKAVGNITVLYKGYIVDEDGLPEITDKEANAIATYCAYVAKNKEGLMTNNAGLIQIASLLKQQWLVQCDQARVPEYINQNEMDQILDAKSNWNRKIFGKSFKPFK